MVRSVNRNQYALNAYLTLTSTNYGKINKNFQLKICGMNERKFPQIILEARA